VLQAEEYKTTMKKIIIAILLLFAVSNVFSQTVFQRRSTESAPFFSWYFNQTDTLGSKIISSDWFDASAIIGQTVYVTDSLYSLGGADTVVIYLYGRTTGDYKYQMLIDTIGISPLITSNATIQVLQETLQNTKYFPEMRWVIQNKSSGGNPRKFKLFLSMYANTTNYLRPHKQYGNLP